MVRKVLGGGGQGRLRHSGKLRDGPHVLLSGSGILQLRSAGASLAQDDIVVRVLRISGTPLGSKKHSRRVPNWMWGEDGIGTRPIKLRIGYGCAAEMSRKIVLIEAKLQCFRSQVRLRVQGHRSQFVVTFRSHSFETFLRSCGKESRFVRPRCTCASKNKKDEMAKHKDGLDQHKRVSGLLTCF